MRYPTARRSGKRWQRIIVFCHACEAATAGEAALIFPVFFLVLFGIIEAGVLFWTQSTLQFAVEAAARCTVVNTTVCNTTSAIQDYAVSQATGLTLSSSSFSVSSPSCGHQVS